MKYIFPIVLLLIIIFATENLFSQSKYIAVESPAGVTTLYTSLSTACDNAVAGSKVYLYAGTIASNVTISKKLYFYGVGPIIGYNNKYTYISGIFTLSQYADSSTFDGISFKDLRIGNSSSFYVNDIVFDNCIFETFAGWYSTTNGYKTYRIILNNCIFYNRVYAITKSKLTNCIFPSTTNVVNSTIDNCVILKQSSYVLNYSSNDTITNSIFLVSTSSSIFDAASLNNICDYNLFHSDVTFPIGTNTGSNNIVNQAIDAICESFGSNASAFELADDYNLLDTSPGKNAGSDSKDIGVYGSSIPFKDTMLPVKPRLSKFNIFYDETAKKWKTHSTTKIED